MRIRPVKQQTSQDLCPKGMTDTVAQTLKSTHNLFQPCFSDSVESVKITLFWPLKAEKSKLSQFARCQVSALRDRDWGFCFN